jgi:hypothetical protein
MLQARVPGSPSDTSAGLASRPPGIRDHHRTTGLADLFGHHVADAQTKNSLGLAVGAFGQKINPTEIVQDAEYPDNQGHGDVNKVEKATRDLVDTIDFTTNPRHNAGQRFNPGPIRSTSSQ